jgi:hypothetical protein
MILIKFDNKLEFHIVDIDGDENLFNSDEEKIWNISNVNNFVKCPYTNC